MLSIGITGGIGSGKSTVVNLFQYYGIPVIDSDFIAHQLVEPTQYAYEKIIEHFSQTILDDAQKLDRKKLREIIINFPEEKKWLESLLHPLIHKEIKKQLSNITKFTAKKSTYTIIDIPLLVNRHDFPYLNRILVIDCPESLQIARIMKRDHLTEAAAHKMIKVQISRLQRNALADDILLNDSNDASKLEKEVAILHKHYLTLSKNC